MYLSTTENLELFEDDLEGHQNLPLKKNMLKGVIIVDIEIDCSKVVQESRLFQVEWLAEHRH